MTTKRIPVLTALMAAGLLTAGPAFAQAQGGGQGGGNPGGEPGGGLFAQAAERGANPNRPNHPRQRPSRPDIGWTPGDPCNGALVRLPGRIVCRM